MRDILAGFTLWGNTGLNYTITIAIFMIVIASIRIFKVMILARFKKFAESTKSKIDDLIVESIEEIRFGFYLFIALWISSQFLSLSEKIQSFFNYTMIIFSVYYCVKIINRIIDFATELEIDKRKKKDKNDASLLNIMSTIVKIAIASFALLMILSNLGVDVTSLIAGLGVGGVAVAFALQRILEDIFSSFSIYFDKPFEEGDFIVVGDDSGTVKHIGLKTTRIRHLNGEELVVSNTELTTARIHNYKKMRKRRIAFSLGVEYDTPVKKLSKINTIVEKIVNSVDKVNLDRVHFKSFGDFSLNYEIVYFLDSNDYATYMNTQQEINMKLKESFEKEKIEFAYPTQTVIVKK